MSDPFAYVPFALAAHGGSVDGTSAAQLTMAGVTLLRTSAPLVRALTARRSAILMPTSAGFLTALAASDGRAAVFLDPASAPHEIAFQLADADVGAVFTVPALAGLLPDGTVHVLLDEAPARATVVAGESRRDVVLSGHEALRLDGDADEPGATDACAIIPAATTNEVRRGVTLTHRDLLAGARAAVDALTIRADDHVLAVLPFAQRFGFTVGALAPLLAGARVTTVAHFSASQTLALLEQKAVTHLVGVPAVHAGLLRALALRERALHAPSLRVAVSDGSTMAVAWQDEWLARTGVALRQG